MDILGIFLIIIPIILLLICSYKYKERFSTVFSQERNIELGKKNPLKVATNPAHAIPFQVEQFENGDDRWKKLKYFHPRNIDFGKNNPRMVATDPSHVIENFSMSGLTNMFSKPNNNINVDKAIPPQTGQPSMGFQSNQPSMDAGNISPLEKQYQSSLEGKSNEQINSEMERQALDNNAHSVQMIN